MQVLFETPVLTRDQLRIALGAPAPVDGTLLPGPFGSLSAIDLADQAEQIKISPVFLGAEELSKLWTAMQARYRPSMAYQVSVVLIQSETPGRDAPPVLQRGRNDSGPVAQGSLAPVLAATCSATSPLQSAVRLGDDLFLTGSGLARANATIQLELPRYQVARTLLPAMVANTPNTSTQLGAHLPSISEDATGMEGWVIGVYAASLLVADPNLPAIATNTVPLAVAPRVTVSPLAASPGTVSLVVTCTPRLRDEQQAATRLYFGSTEVLPDNITNPGDPTQPTTLAFTITGVPAGRYPVRLRVDGIDSLPVVFSGTPARFDFDPQQTVVVA
jgi:hypothetical protein